jgi:hypothetical protein
MVPPCVETGWDPQGTSYSGTNESFLLIGDRKR